MSDREAFEKWARGDMFTFLDDNGRYTSVITEKAWQAWQAAQAQAVCPHVVTSGTTSWCRLAQSSQAQAGKPIAAVRGYYNGMCVVDTVGDENVLPVGMALYSQPQAQAGDAVGEVYFDAHDAANVFWFAHPQEGAKLYAAPPAAVNQQLLEALEYYAEYFDGSVGNKARAAIAAAQEQSK